MRTSILLVVVAGLMSSQEARVENGPYPVGGDVERPRALQDLHPIDGLISLMRSGDYGWGVCIVEVTIDEEGRVTKVDFLKPESLDVEVETVIVEAALGWRFSPATLDGTPVPVLYNLLIHHCPLRRIDRSKD